MHSPIPVGRSPSAVRSALSRGVAACGSDDDNGVRGGSGAAAASKAQKVGVLLPDTKSSVRWETSTGRCSRRRSTPPACR